MVVLSGLLILTGSIHCAEETKCACGLTDTGPTDAATPPDTNVPPADIPDSQEEVADTSTPDAAVTPLPGQPDGYTPGGMMARYFDGAAPNADELPETPFLWRMEPELSLTKTQGDFATLNDGKLFTTHLEGALYVAEAGSYTMMVTVSDSVRVKIHGQTVLDMWKAGEQLTLETTLALEAGWHPLDIVYARDPFRAHLQIWFALEGELVQPLASEALGFSQELPADAPELTGEATFGDAYFYHAAVSVNANVPVKVNGVVTQGASETTHTESLYSSVHAFNLPLQPDNTAEATLTLEDLWGRSMTLPAQTLTTDAIPSYTAGGLLGTYHDGMAFDTVVGQRVDGPVNIPFQYGLGTTSDMGMPNGIDNFSIRWEGGLLVPSTGTYTLYFGTDDGQRLWVDGELVGDMWVNHAPAYVAATLYLAEGWHPIAAEMYEASGGAQAVLEWDGPDTIRQVIPGQNLGFVAPIEDGNLPIVTPSIQFVGPEKDTVHVMWSSDKMTTATAEWMGSEGLESVTTTTLATVGSATLKGVPPAATTAVTITAATATGVLSNPATLDVALAEPPANATFVELFDGEEFEPEWTVVTQGKTDPTASWALNNGDVVENGNAHGNGALGYDTLGTFLWAPNTTFSQGTLMAHIYSGDDDGFGLMWGIQGEETYYRFTLRYEQSFAHLVRVDNGVFTLLAEDPDYMPPQKAWYLIEVQRNGDEHSIVVDGETIMTVTDDTHSGGSVAIYSWGMTNYRTDFVAITP